MSGGSFAIGYGSSNSGQFAHSKLLVVATCDGKLIQLSASVHHAVVRVHDVVVAIDPIRIGFQVIESVGDCGYGLVVHLKYLPRIVAKFLTIRPHAVTVRGCYVRSAARKNQQPGRNCARAC